MYCFHQMMQCLGVYLKIITLLDISLKMDYIHCVCVNHLQFNICKLIILSLLGHYIYSKFGFITCADPSGAQSLPQGIPSGGGGMPPTQNPAYSSMPPQIGDYQQQGAFNMQGMEHNKEPIPFIFITCWKTWGRFCNGIRAIHYIQ